MFPFICMIAVLNLAVGFALAVAMGPRRQAVALADVPTSTPPVGEPPPAESPIAEDAGGNTPPEDRANRIEELRQQVAVHSKLLADLDQQVRCAVSDEEVRQLRLVLHQASSDYHTQHWRLFAELRSSVEWDEELAQLEQSVRSGEPDDATLDDADSQTNPDGENGTVTRRAVLDEIQRLLTETYQARDVLESVQARAARVQGGLDTLAASDETTGLASRAYLEQALSSLGSDDRWNTELSGVFLDVDDLARVNRQHGPATGLAVVKVVADTVRAESDADLAFRYGGQRFLLLLPGVAVHQASERTERIRRTIEATTFRHGDDTFLVTVSCAVVAAAAGDDQVSFFARMEETMREAKRYGRNRTFCHEGEYPTPVAISADPVEAREKTL